ncbi:MAG TPA: glycoside hydrolase family 127 protein [Tepidisphaeraceae bacterium]|nr:glycoside hydrolase family 127 protein [Tepidisphaeraceae bacterium]
MSITCTTRSPFVRARSVGFGQVRWTVGFWAERFALCCQTMVPAMGRLLTQTERERFLGNFEVACGLVEGRHRGPKWDDGDFYKWLEAAAVVYHATKDPGLDAELDRIIDLIARTQDPDGYIHTDVQIAQRKGDPAGARRFANPLDFEMYNMGHLITAAVVHHRATGKHNLLNVALKTADFLDRTFANPTPQQARHGICPSHLMGLVELYRLTNQKRYLDLAVRLLNMRDLVEQGDDDNQDRIPFRQQRTAHGHAVRATYLYAGAADIYAETGDESLMQTLEPVWQDLVMRKLYITGGCGALYDGASPDGAVDQKQITRVHQAFGRNYQLPHSTAHNETCAAVGNVLWNWRMLQITGESRFGDVIEQTLYNGILCGISLNGVAFFYTNTLRQLNPMPVELRWPRQRARFMSCWCCPPNVVRIIAEAANFAYAVSDRGVYVVLYGSNELDTSLPDGSPIRLTQQTHYPWDGTIRIRVEQVPAAECSILLRIPGWAKDASIRINGRDSAAGPVPGTFCELRRTWARGDLIELMLPMPPRLLEAHPYVEEARNQVAVMRGPIVYCLESTDLAPGVRVLEVLVPADVELVPQRSDVLGGAVVLHGRAIAQPAGDWNARLYRDLAATPATQIPLTLIPYFAWGNRGESEMTVWLPLARR